jgi:hypothetical protein
MRRRSRSKSRRREVCTGTPEDSRLWWWLKYRITGQGRAQHDGDEWLKTVTGFCRLIPADSFPIPFPFPFLRFTAMAL